MQKQIPDHLRRLWIVARETVDQAYLQAEEILRGPRAEAKKITGGPDFFMAAIEQEIDDATDGEWEPLAGCERCGEMVFSCDDGHRQISTEDGDVLVYCGECAPPDEELRHPNDLAKGHKK